MRKKYLWVLIMVIIGNLSGMQISATEFRQYASSSAYYNVFDYGAKANGKEKDTHSVQLAIDSCSRQGGGTIYFPPGTYLCGSLHLKSNVALFLDHGSIIMMSKDNEDFDPYETLNFKNKADRETSYFHYALIWGEDLEHIAILGTGSIDCNRTKRGGPITGITDHPIENITFDNIIISYLGGGSFDGKIENVLEEISEYPESDMFGALPAYGFYCRHVRNLKLHDIILTVESKDKRYAFVFDDLEKLNIESIDTERSEAASPVMRFNSVKQAVISGCIIPKDISRFMEVPENQKNEIQIFGNGIFQKF